MAEMNEYRSRRERNFLLVVISLAIICGGLGFIMVKALQGAGTVEDDDNLRRLLTQLAWTAMVLMVGTALLLVWALVRSLGRRVAAPLPKGEKGERIDAWAEAGRRFEVDPNEDADPDDPA
jgi:hypothetical protein